MLDSTKLKEFADDNFKLDKNGRKFSKWVENTVEKGRNCSLRAISPFSHSVFKKIRNADTKKPGLVWERFKPVFLSNNP